MSSILEKINEPKDLRKLKLNNEGKKQLAKEIREYIIKNVSKTGGHLASSLGAVEITIALHDVFNTPEDKIIWDVGHQTYAHKILTGRKDRFNTLRKLNGIAGFPKTSESEYDNFNTGHSSTSISAALGMARARDIKNEDYKVVAVIGDGALTGGMALEALNDVGASNTNMIVILNDNQMSIEKNNGGIAKALTNMRTKKFYTNSNRTVKRIVMKVPVFGRWVIKKVRRIKFRLKQILLPDIMFEEIGFKYLGPVDGNNIETLEALLRRAKDLSGPILIHCKTVKGKGYRFAEENPDKFHSISSFNIETGMSIKEKNRDYSAEFGDMLVDIASRNDNVVAVTAAMAAGTGLSKFKETFPDRFFDVEIAEQHAITMAAGMAIGGLIPVVPIYSSFLQRGYDQIIHDVCMQNLHVVFGVDRSGIVGADGETHQGLLDMAFLRSIPNISILAPKDFKELDKMLEFAINEIKTPVSIRYPRGGESNIDFKKIKELNIKNKNESDKEDNIIIGKSEEIKKGKDITIIAIGKMVSRAVEVSKILEKNDNIDTQIINARFLKPFDKNMLINNTNKRIYTIEDGTIIGGLFSAVAEIIENENLEKRVLGFGYKDKFVQHGTVEELEKINKMDLQSIYIQVLEDYKKQDIKDE